jgi:RNA polymerase sigma-70 factor, ECF subfamily
LILYFKNSFQLFGGWKFRNCLYEKQTDSLDKTKVIELINQSDKNAFNELFGHYFKRLCRFAYVILKCEQSAEEVVQEVFIKLWENRKKLTIAINIDSYLFVAVKNTSMNLLKLNQTRMNYESNPDLVNDSSSSTFDSATFIRHLEKAIEKLPEQCRMIYHLKNFEGLSYSEIAEYLDISEKTVENQVSLALGKLRELLFQHKNDFYETE